MPGRNTPTTPPSEVLRRIADITAQNESLVRRLAHGEQRFRGLAKAVWKVQEEERRRLARELHDGIGQTVTALINQLQRVQQSGGASDGAGLAEAVRIAEIALQDVREMSRLLRPAVLDDLGLAAGLAWLARTLREHTGLETTLDCPLDEGERLDAELETVVFRIVQEGLNNVVKHAGVREARVAVRRRHGSLEVEIADGGRGFDAARTLSAAGGADGLGLRGIRDRIELFGGQLEVRTAPGHGCRLCAAIPASEPA